MTRAASPFSGQPPRPPGAPSCACGTDKAEGPVRRPMPIGRGSLMVSRSEWLGATVTAPASLLHAWPLGAWLARGGAQLSRRSAA